MNQEETEKLIYEIIYDVINKNEFIKEHFRFVPDKIELKIKSIDFRSDTFFESSIYKYPYDYSGNKYEFGMGGFYDITFEYEGILDDKKNWVNFGGFEKERIKSEFFRIFKTELISTSRDYKLKSLNLTMKDKINNSLTEYLGFNSNELFKDSNLTRVFGGAIRDIINSDAINDIDILCGSKSCKYVENILSYYGYHYMESMTPKDLSSIYTDINVINEPHSWIKGSKVVQIIRPRTDFNITFDVYKKTFKELISNVDISSCGVSYDGANLYENYPDAITHILNKVYVVNKEAKMYSERRIVHRKQKFSERGWTEIDKNKKEDMRDIKINSLLNEFTDFIMEHPSIVLPSDVKMDLDSLLS